MMQQKGYTRENERLEPQKMNCLEDDSPFQTSEFAGSSRWFFKGVMVGWLRVLKVDWLSDKWVILQMDKMDYDILHDVIVFYPNFGFDCFGDEVFCVFFLVTKMGLFHPRKEQSSNPPF